MTDCVWWQEDGVDMKRKLQKDGSAAASAAGGVVAASGGDAAASAVAGAVLLNSAPSSNSNPLVPPLQQPAPQHWKYSDIQIDTDSPTNLYQFKADGGFVGPLAAPGIFAYQQCDAAIKQIATGFLVAEWDMLTDAFIRSKWPGGSDIFYVVVDQVTKEFIGTVAVDRVNFHPYISNLFVVPGKRGQGHGKRILEHGIAFTKSMNFPDARLWCKKELLPWYLSMGWVQDGIQDDVILMRKACS